MNTKNIYSLLNIFISLLLFENINTKIELTENKKGEIDGYYYELWNSDNIGLSTMTIENANQFSCSWSDVDSVLFLLGERWKRETVYLNSTDITINYDLEFNPEGYSYISINGYFSQEYEEFNIVENSENFKMNFKKSLGYISADHGTYDLYYNEVIYPPNIHGIQRKTEYWSIRREKRSSGTVSFGKHLEAWEKKGLLYDRIIGLFLKIEGYQSKGSANVNNIELNIVKNN